MRTVVQRVKDANVKVDGDIKGEVGAGLIVYLGVADDDTEEDIVYMADKVRGLRIFEDDEEKMNLSVEDIKGEILVISQFTLFGDVRKGKRPSFTAAARPDKGNEYYKKFVSLLKEKGIVTEQGVFGADMKINATVDGPVTILLDSKKLF